MKKILPLLLTITILSCNKNTDTKPKYDPAPSVSNIQSTTETTNGVTRPKFTITLAVPDTAATKVFILFYKGSSIPCAIPNPKTGTYTIIDTYNTYPLSGDKKNYTSAFVMADNSTIGNSSFTIF